MVLQRGGEVRICTFRLLPNWKFKVIRGDFDVPGGPTPLQEVIIKFISAANIDPPPLCVAESRNNDCFHTTFW